MGSTSQNRPAGTSDRDFFQDLMMDGHTILECATIGRNTFYAAVQQPDSTVIAFVALITWTGGYWNFTYKTMTETSGPGVFDCPARVLDTLTPLPTRCEAVHPLREWGICSTCTAREWRAECRKVAANRARAATVKPGQVIRFARPIKFTSGTELDTLTFSKRDVFTSDGYRYRVTGWRAMSGWELIRPAS